MRRVTQGRGDEAMARILVEDSGPTVRWLHGRGLRFRLMYERQAYEVDGRHRFWGGLAVGTVDGGDGSDRPAPRGGRRAAGSSSATARR